ncbi:MAG TPA: MDR family MFS transporter [Ktedonobacteraceae bacterium]|nr:MDR family MFS transporter [Ktedonobacteraceae bacterium]
MTTASISIPTGTNTRPNLRGFALVSVMFALMLTLLLEALDQAIVGTAMPRIIEELHGLDRYSWVVTAYILASMTMIPIVGKLSDQFGRKWFLLSGTVLFLLGSILAGASQSMDQLILFRAVQGLGSGIGIALISTIMADLFPPDQRAKWSGLFGLVYGVSTLFGPTIGGWLAEHGPLMGNLVTDATRWRWIFYINVPVGLIAVVALMIFLPANLSVRTSAWNGWASLRQIDILGAILCAAATICLMLGLTLGGAQTSAWTSPQVIAMLAAAMLLLTLFFFVERKASEPILPLDLFRNPVFSVSASLSLLQLMVIMSLSLYLPLFFQGVLAVSPTNAGLVMTPFSVSMVVGAMLSSQIIGRFRHYRLVAIASAFVMSAGAFCIALMTPTIGIAQAIAILVLTGIGIGPFFSLPMVAVQNALPAERLGTSTAGLRYLGQLGASLGIAIMGTVVASSASGNLMNHFPTTTTAKLALSVALQHGFIAVLAFALIALIATFFLKDRLIIAKQEKPDPEAESVVAEQADEESDKVLVHA